MSRDSLCPQCAKADCTCQADHANSILDAIKPASVKKFEQYIDAHWPAHLKTADGKHIDCTKLDEHDVDCLDRTTDDREWCESCKTYNDLTVKYYEENPDA